MPVRLVIGADGRPTTVLLPHNTLDPALPGCYPPRMRHHRVPLRFLAVIVLLAGIVSSAQADMSTLEGQIVCSECWFEADRSQVPYGTPGDLACAARCNKDGIPAAMAIRSDGAFELLLLPDDPPAGAGSWLELISRFARVTGEVDRHGEDRVMHATAVELLDKSPWLDLEVGAISWTDLSGHRFSLESLRGRVVVLNFWATWCAPCREEMPDLVRIQNRYGMLGVQVIGASVDPADLSDAVLKDARRANLNFPVLLGADTRQMESLGLLAALPGTVVLDREGQVIERFNGVFDPGKLKKAIEGALSGSGPHGRHTALDRETAPVRVAKAARSQASLVPS